MKRLMRLLGVVAVMVFVMTGIAAAATTLKITKQPVTLYAQAGTTAKFTVTATTSATSLSYQWQYRKNSSDTWKSSGQSGNKTATLSVSVTAGMDGYQFRCVVSDSAGQKAYSSAATLYTHLKITTWPKDTEATVGSTAKFTMAAVGPAPLTYQWQYRKNSADSWKTSGQSGNKTNTLSVAVTAGLNGYQFRCYVTDATGQRSYTNTVTLTVKTKITTWPKDTYSAAGETAKFTVAATGAGPLKYQWQYRKNSSDTWKTSGQSGNKTATLSVAATAGLDGYQFRCYVTDANGERTYTNTVMLSIILKITTQPVDTCVSLGTTAAFTVAATGTGTLTCQWQYMSPRMTSWKDSGQSGNKTAKLSVKTTASLQGYKFRCVITHGNGNKAYSNAATLTLCDIPINETYFPNATFRQYIIDHFDTTKDGKLSKDEILAVISIAVSYSQMSSLKGIEFFSALTELYCYGNNLTALDVCKNTALTKLFCSENNLTALDVSRNTALMHLECDGNNLTALDVSKNTVLTKLFCSDNNLTALNASGCTALTELNCYNNNLTALDVSKNTALTDLGCENNNLTALDVSKNTALKGLACKENNLTTLDVSGCTALEALHCNNNNLTALNVSKNTALMYLYCSENNLTALNVSGCTVLKQLSCSSNNLTALDVSKNTALTYLECGGNNLTALDVSKNTALTELWCGINNLTTLDVSKNTALTWLSCHGNNLTALEVSKNTGLWQLYCYNNNLTALNVSKNTALKYLTCDRKVTVTGAGNGVHITYVN